MLPLIRKHSDVKNAMDWTRELEGSSVLSHNTTLSGGVGILFTKRFSPVSYQVEEVFKDRLFYFYMCVYVPPQQ